MSNNKPAVATELVTEAQTQVARDLKYQDARTKSAVAKRLRDVGNDGLFIFDHDSHDGETMDFRHSTDRGFRQVMVRALNGCIGQAQTASLGEVYPVEMLAKNRHHVIGEFRRHEYYIESGVDEDGDVVEVSHDNIHTGLKVLSDLLADRVHYFQTQVAERAKRGSLTFDDLPYYFIPGSDVIVIGEAGSEIAGRVGSTSINKTYMGMVFLTVSVEVIHSVGGIVQPGRYQANIFGYRGARKLDELGVQILDAARRAKLTERGKTFKKFASGVHYASYVGQLTRSSWWEDNMFRADGRVMLDFGSFKRIDNEQHTRELRSSGLEALRDREDAAKGVVNYDLQDGDLWRTWPFVYGFSFRAKTWGKLCVSGLSDIQWRSESYEKLVLPEDQKTMIRALVEHNDGSFSDIIEGKGGGCIFLLHGPPGQGKTLTAETIAELLKRPLYAISVGELGVTPDQLEERLRTILDVATTWNAVILLDEADIYLEARDERDIVRNAMVGVFLRLLEYHQGVLFLTTNRVRNIDTAFYSRISVALHFSAADDSKREQIWTNLLQSAGVAGIDVKQLAGIDINGRQIKNAIRLAQTLAKAEKKKVDIDLLRKVISLMTAFDRERAEAATV